MAVDREEGTGSKGEAVEHLCWEKEIESREVPKLIIEEIDVHKQPTHRSDCLLLIPDQ